MKHENCREISYFDFDFDSEATTKSIIDTARSALAAVRADVPEWVDFRSEYAELAQIMIEADERGFFKMKPRDFDLCCSLFANGKITRKQLSWLGGISLNYLQDGVYEGFSWWSSNSETNLISRWRKALDVTGIKPESTSKVKPISIPTIESIVGSEFMQRFQKVIANKL